MIKLVALALFLFTPVSAGAQTFTFEPQSTTTVSYQLQQKLVQTIPAVQDYRNILTPTLYSDPIGTLEAALANPRPSIFAVGTSSNTALITTLLAQVAVLQKQIDAIIASSTPTSIPGIPDVVGSSTPSSVTSGACPLITRMLIFGARGSDVTELQTFLISEQLLTPDSASGFFGALTEAAVQAWQSAKAIITEGTPTTSGYGAVGPKTRAALAACK